MHVLFFQNEYKENQHVAEKLAEAAQCLRNVKDEHEKIAKELLKEFDEISAAEKEATQADLACKLFTFCFLLLLLVTHLTFGTVKMNVF